MQSKNIFLIEETLRCNAFMWEAQRQQPVNPLDFFADKGYNFIMKTASGVNTFVKKGFASFFYF